MQASSASRNYPAHIASHRIPRNGSPSPENPKIPQTFERTQLRTRFSSLNKMIRSSLPAHLASTPISQLADPKLVERGAPAETKSTFNDRLMTSAAKIRLPAHIAAHRIPRNGSPFTENREQPQTKERIQLEAKFAALNKIRRSSLPAHQASIPIFLHADPKTVKRETLAGRRSPSIDRLMTSGAKIRLPAHIASHRIPRLDFSDSDKIKRLSTIQQNQPDGSLRTLSSFPIRFPNAHLAYQPMFLFPTLSPELFGHETRAYTQPFTTDQYSTEVSRYLGYAFPICTLNNTKIDN